jgi:serine/threonine-protein kinase
VCVFGALGSSRPAHAETPTHLWQDHPGQGGRAAPALPDLVSRSRPAVVHVRGRAFGPGTEAGRRARLSVGTGFFVEASGLVITKYALASWTVKCTDRASGEEIYFDSALPKGLGSYASEEAALRVVGTKVADSFSRDFFLAHVPVRGRKTSLALAGLPDDAADALLQEIVALPAVIGARMPAAGSPRVYDVEMRAGNGSQAIVDDIIRPLNAKLGDACFSVGTTTPERSAVAFDARCAEGLRARLESSPPAALFDAPPERRKAIISNPEMRKKLLV